MALPDYSNTYAAVSSQGDDELLKRRRELASRLYQARQRGETIERALGNEMGSGGAVQFRQQGGTDSATRLSEEELAGFAQRLYGGQYDPKKPLKGSPSGSRNASQVQASPTYDPNPTATTSTTTLPPVGGNVGEGAPPSQGVQPVPPNPLAPTQPPLSGMRPAIYLRNFLDRPLSGVQPTPTARPAPMLDEYEQRPFGTSSLRQPTRKLGTQQRWDWWNS
jgi:hypothetical protein